MKLICLQVLRAQLELGQVRQEIDRRLAEKEEEFNNNRYVPIPFSSLPNAKIPTNMYSMYIWLYVSGYYFLLIEYHDLAICIWLLSCVFHTSPYIPFSAFLNFVRHSL